MDKEKIKDATNILSFRYLN